MKRYSLIAILSIAAALAGCGTHSAVGLVDVQRLVTNWQEYQGYQNQMYSEERSISSRRESNVRKQRDAIELQQKYGKITDRLSKQIRDAAGKIATDRRLKLVLTREGVGYGGVDITSDVEKALNITEKPSPSP